MKKVLTLIFSEPFALQKVRKTSFIKILQGRVYYKAVESTNSTLILQSLALPGQLNKAFPNPSKSKSSLDLRVKYCFVI